MIKIKKISKLIILFIFLLSIISSLTPKVISDTTRGDSTVPVEVGDFYKWKMTYCHPDLSQMYGIGSYKNLTIIAILKSTIALIPNPPINALIIRANYGKYAKGLNSHISFEDWLFLIYNASLHYLHISDEAGLLIAPVPLNLTMVADALTNSLYAIDRNVLKLYPGSGNEEIYKFNSNGIVTNYIAYYESEKFFEYTLIVKEERIPFGNYYLLVSLFTIIYIYLIIKKQKHTRFR